MHNNYFFLQHLKKELNKLLIGATLIESFTQEKDELVILLQKDDKNHYLRAHLTQRFSCLEFPENYHKAKKNTTSLFDEITEEKIIYVGLSKHDRLMWLELTSNYQLTFKLFGNRSNIILSHQGQIKSIFKNKLKNDFNLDLNSPHRDLNLTYDHFRLLNGDFKKFNPTLGPLVVNYLNQQVSGNEAAIDIKWQAYQEIYDLLQNASSFYIVDYNEEPHLSLIPVGTVVSKVNDPLSALNTFYKYYFSVHLLKKIKEEQSAEILKLKKRLQKSIEKSEESLRRIEQSPPPSQLADVIMANLHTLGKSGEPITLLNFYTSKEEIVKIPESYTPQKYAEKLYRKSKNRFIELEELQNKISSLKTQLEELTLKESYILDSNSIGDLKKEVKKRRGAEEESHPYREIVFDNYTILVGKNDKSNDLLLRNFSSKNDVWMHARDVAGSHVIIRKQSQNIPAYIIERGAEIAAYYSKRKNERLVPVIWTERKYVRKFKGARPGQVKVDIEQVIMASPKS